MDALIQYIKTLLETNMIASGGLFVMVVGAIWAYIYRIFPPIVGFIKRRSIVVMDISNNDDTFKWFSNWLATTNYAKRTNLLTVISRSKYSDNKKPILYFVPAPGNHVFFYKRKNRLRSTNFYYLSVDRRVKHLRFIERKEDA